MTWCREIEDHYRRVWRASPEVCASPGGPVHEMPNGFAVLRVPPHGPRAMWTYATRCMSEPDDERPIELHMVSPWEAGADVVELLYATAHFHRTATRLDLGHSVNFGRSWIGASECDHGLVSLPYLDGPELEVLTIGSRRVNCYWLIPITRSERDFKMRRGVDALEEEFERAGFDYLDPARPSVV